jgi:hypothetical protein
MATTVADSDTCYANVVSIRGVLSQSALPIEEMQALKQLPEPDPPTESIIRSDKEAADAWTRGAQDELTIIRREVLKMAKKRHAACAVTVNTDERGGRSAALQVLIDTFM